MQPWTSPRSRPRTRTFVSLTGPAGNIGDALIRRATYEWARGTSDDVVAYVGDAPEVWLRQLGLASGTRVLRSKRSVAKWLWLIVTAPRHPVLIFEAGEIPLDRGNGMRELVFLTETVIVRLKGGVVVRPPRGIRAPSQPSLGLHRLAARLSQIALWREASSHALAAGGALAPDIGFGAGIRDGAAPSERGEIIVSLRGTRPFPGPSWVTALRSVAREEGLRIRTVVQVREDEDRARELADALGGVAEPWGDADAVEQEKRLRARYESASLVVSDRMHVLVLAALSGASPAEAVPRPTGKIAAAFRTVGYEDLSIDSATADAATLAAFLRSQLRRGDELRARVATADADLLAIEDRIRATIRAART